MKKKIKLLLVEDNRILREGIAAMLNKQHDINVVATIGNGENISGIIEKVIPDIMLLDLGLRSQNSLEIVKLIVERHPETKIIVMDLIPLQEDVYDYVQAGVSGFTLKDANISDFLAAIRSVYEGNKVLPQNLTGSLFSQIVKNAIHSSKHSLIEDAVRMTKREKQVIELVADGATNKEIAQKLHLSPFTVKSHVHNILEKLTLTTRVQIAKHAHLSEEYNSNHDSTSLDSE